MNTSDVLYRAADLIEERGWTQYEGWGDLLPGGNARSELCLEGGVAAAMGFKGMTALDDLWQCPAYRAVADYLGMDVTVETRRFASGREYVVGEPSEPLWRWNDDVARTAAEVIGVLRAAAVVEAARESQPAEQVTV